MANLLSDIQWIFCGNSKSFYEAEISNFVLRANDEFDKSYGSPEVNTTLIIAGEDWFLERKENDGAEWLEFKTRRRSNDI